MILYKKKKKRKRKPVIRRDKKGMPLTIDILTADDMHKGDLIGPNNTYCLLGHLQRCFAGAVVDDDPDNPVPAKIRKRMDEAEEVIKGTIKEFKDGFCKCP